MGTPLRLAIVLPRFGEQISGGAELHGRWLAERLSEIGHDVDVYTTCAVDHASWRNELEPGVESYKGLRVHRFTTTDRDLGIHGELSLAIAAGVTLSPDEELLWLRHGGSSEAMEEALRERGEDYDAVIAMPYLWGTTYSAYAACPSKTVIIPCLHDEAFAHMSFVEEMLSGARGLLFNTEVEASLARTLIPSLAPWGIVGVGFDPLPASSLRRRRRVKIPEPSILCVGRREPGKNTPLLIEYFRRYRSRRAHSVVLVFAGGGDPVPKGPDFLELKPDWSSPYDVYRAATMVCQPSTNESLSIVLLQAWLAERPALVHGSCTVTRDHCERANGGLWFTSYAEFEEVLDRMLASATLRDALARNGRTYVEREYSWPVVLDRFHAAMNRILTGRVPLGVETGAR